MKAKTLNDCKDEVAISYGYKHYWDAEQKCQSDGSWDCVSIMHEAAELYASQRETVQLKAEDILKTSESFNYSEDNLDETHYYHDNVILAMKEYARIQIVKDRERVKSDFKSEHFCDDYHYNMVQNGIDLTPIILD